MSNRQDVYLGKLRDWGSIYFKYLGYICQICKMCIWAKPINTLGCPYTACGVDRFPKGLEFRVIVNSAK